MSFCLTQVGILQESRSSGFNVIWRSCPQRPQFDRCQTGQWTLVRSQGQMIWGKPLRINRWTNDEAWAAQQVSTASLRTHVDMLKLPSGGCTAPRGLSPLSLMCLIATLSALHPFQGPAQCASLGRSCHPWRPPRAVLPRPISTSSGQDVPLYQTPPGKRRPVAPGH